MTVDYSGASMVVKREYEMVVKRVFEWVDTMDYKMAALLVVDKVVLMVALSVDYWVFL